MDEWEWVFFYNEDQNNVESVTTFHQLECDIGSLAEAHKDVIYFYAEFGPIKEWDFNEVATMPLFEMDPEMPMGEVKIITDMEVRSISLDSKPNAFGYGIDHATLYVVQDGQEHELNDSELWERQNDAFRGRPS